VAGVPEVRSQTTPAPRSRLALLSFLLGLLVVPFLCVTGVPALFLGYLALRLVNESDGRLRGQRLASAAIVLGVMGTAITAVGLLAGYILHLRGTASRVTCQNNLRVIGRALAAYHEEHAQYPAAIIPNLTLTRPDQHLSWLAAILPYLDPPMPSLKAKSTAPRPGPAQVAWEHLNVNQAWDAEENRAAATTYIRWFVCDAYDGRAVPQSPALTTYVGLSGIGPDAASLPASDPRAGFFGYDRTVTRDKLQAARGESRTMIVAETSFMVGPWAVGGAATVRDLDPAQRPYSGPGRPFGGNHPGGLNVLFVDGVVEWYSDNTDPHILEAMVPIAAPED
jgi:prepilin-type processing-associated H-X9-DG protein